MRKATLFMLSKSGLYKYLMVAIITISWQSIYAQDDCPPITVFCHDLHTSFMPDVCMVEIWAKDFISKINDANTSLDDFIITFDEEGNEMNMVFFGEDGTEYTPRIWIISKCDPNIRTSCVVNLTINDNTGECTKLCPIDVNEWCGYSVVTCSAALPGDNIAAIIDIRQNSLAPRGDDWADPATPNADEVDLIHPEAWTLGRIGMVYGIALKPNTGDIFLAASDVYAYDFKQFVSVGFPPPSCSGPAGPGGIYKSSFNADPSLITATPIIFSDTVNYLPDNQIIGTNKIPNFGNTRECDVVTIEQLLERPKTGNGIGNIAYDRFSNHLFVTNLEDGKIYSISCETNTVTDIFDPFSPYDHTVDGPGLVDSLERIWGIQTLACERPVKLFFARENMDGNVDNLTNRPKQIWSVQVDDTGRFIGEDGDENLEFTVDLGRQLKITDIAFNAKCERMLVAERGDHHKARVFEYVLDNGQWTFEKRVHVGINDDDAPAQEDGVIRGTSAAGGVSYGPSEVNGVVDNKCDSIIWATVNCGDIIAKPERCDVYGLEGVSINGNDRTTNGATDIFIDFNPEFTQDPLNFKSNIGEVEVFNCCCCEETGRNILNNPTRALAGVIQTPMNNKLSDVDISISSNSMSTTIQSDADGHFQINDLKVNEDYMISPKKDGDISDGVTTLDLLLIQRHILGLRNFVQPHQYIAADINASGKISALDLVELRRVILGIQNEYSNNNVWNFIPELPSMSELQNSILYNSYLMVDNLSSDFMHADFSGIKTGDINNDNSIEKQATSRSSLPLNLIYEIISLPNGFSKVSFYASENSNISGIQFALSGIENNSIIEIEPASLGLTNDNYALLNDAIAFSWNSNDSKEIKSDEPLLNIIVRGDVGRDLSLNNDIIYSEAYDENLSIKGISLQKLNLSQVDAELSIYPNPARDNLHINFNLENSEEYEVNIFSQNGQLNYKSIHNAQKGHQSIRISTENTLIQESGVYIVKVILNNKILTKKLVLIK